MEGKAGKEFMDHNEFRTYVEKKIKQHEKRCRTLREEPDDRDMVMTLVGKTMKGLPVRPKILEHRENGEKIYAFNLKQCRKLVKAIDEATT